MQTHICYNKLNSLYQNVKAFAAEKRFLMIVCKQKIGGKHVFSKTLLLFLVLTFALSAFAGCGETKQQESGSASAVDVSSEESGFPLQDKNFGGKEITILCVYGGRTYGELQFKSDSEITANPINDAVENRNNLIEEKYGITVKTIVDDAPAELFRRDINAGLQSYDMISDTIMALVPLIPEGVFLPLDDYIDLESPRWDRDANKTLTFNDNHYLVAGDAIITDDDYTYLLLYNKTMLARNPEIQQKYGDIYDLVRNGEWTFDIMMEMAKCFAQPDENGERTADATYGVCGSAIISNAFMNAAGLLPVRQTEDGLTLTIGTSENIRVFDKVYDMFSDKRTVMLVENFGSEGWDLVEQSFAKGRSLFYSTTASKISQFKNFESDVISFGVLPNPKYHKDQDRYYNTVNAGLATVLAVAANNDERLEATCYLMELMAYYGQNAPFQTVNDAYYQTTLKLQAVESDDDAQMLDIVFNNRIYDTYAIMPWGSAPTVGQIYSYVLMQPSNTLVSVFDAHRESYEQGIRQTLETFAKMN